MEQPKQKAHSAVRFTSEEQLRNAVRAIIVELAPQRKGEFETSARLTEDLGYHSLALLELAFSLEDEFALSPLDEATARRIQTVNDVLDHVVTEFRASGRLG